MFLLAGGLIAAVALSLVLHGAAIAERPAINPGHPALRLLLRLHDLPAGYTTLRFEDDGPPKPDVNCDALSFGDSQPRLMAFVTRFSPGGCEAIYGRVYTVPGGTPAPLYVGTAALDPGSVPAAERGLALASELFVTPNGKEAAREVAPPAIGDAARLFHWDVGKVLGAGIRGASFLFWRSASTVAIVFATGRSLHAADHAALVLARRQQVHIENPTPYTRAERDETELLLDNPRLDFPILWLGRRFSPGNGLGDAGLMQAIAGPFAPREEQTFLYYSRHILIASERERTWDPKRDGPRGLGWNCTRSHRIDLPYGFATLYGSYGPRLASCPHRPPRIFSAVVHSHGMATTIEVQVPLRDAGTQGEYDSFRGVATLARGLVVRPRPSY